LFLNQNEVKNDNFFFLRHWSLNPAPYMCEAGALPFELFYQPFFMMGVFKKAPQELFARGCL
jgi:hypothetical protein